MDNATLLDTLVILLGINTVFTYTIVQGQKKERNLFWRRSSFVLFAGFLLLLFQGKLHLFISVLIANYLILTGFYMQTRAAVYQESGKSGFGKLFFSLLTAFYWVLFPYFTFFHFDTSLRIMIISLALVIIYSYGAMELYQYRNRTVVRSPYTTEIYYLFLFSIIFYAFRFILTLSGYGRVLSLFERNMAVSLSLIYPIIFNMIFMISMNIAYSRSRNHIILLEKDKQKALFDFLNDTARHLELDELFESIKRILNNTMGVDTAAIFLKNSDGTHYSLAYSFDVLDLPMEQIKTLKKGEGAAGKAISEDRVVEMEMSSYPNKELADIYLKKGCRYLISIPLKNPDGIIGAITVAYTDRMIPDLMDREFLYYLGEQIGLVLHNAYLYRIVSQMAMKDPLTNLYNRRRMMELLETESKRAIRYGTGFVIVMMDLDHFKSINDTLGHECGDEVLKHVSRLITRECRDTDVASRWGGEEFLLLILEPDLDSAIMIAERIRDSLEKTMIPCLKGKNITGSLGLSLFQGELSLSKNIALADEALYRAKENGRNRIETA